MVPLRRRKTKEMVAAAVAAVARHISLKTGAKPVTEPGEVWVIIWRHEAGTRTWVRRRPRTW